MRERIRRWAAEPLVVPRSLLTAKYAMFAVLGAVGAVAGIPAFSLTTWEGYTPIWGALLLGSSLIAAAASTHRRYETIERWPAVVVTALMASYSITTLILAVGDGHTGRAAVGWALLIVTLLPGFRATQLVLRTGANGG